MALAVLQAGEYPLWFECTEAGPRQISFPDESGLSPFIPWPLARHIRFILPRGEELVMGVNRDGFLRFAPWEDTGAAPANSRGAERNNAEKGGASARGRGVALYRSADPAYWGQYTLAAVFPFAGKAAALLYRDDFFTETVAPLPAPRFFALDPGSPEPRALEIPAFGDFPATEGWDLDALRAGPGGYWYYRGIRKNAGQPEIVYYRTRDFDRKGEAVSVSGFQNAALPEPLSAAPALLRTALEAAFALDPGAAAATVVSPAFPGPRHFSGGLKGTAGSAEREGAEGAGPESAGDLAVTGFYREPGAGGPGIALAVLPGGGGIFCAGGGGTAGETVPGEAAAPRPQRLSLPALPAGFAYTAAALCGDTLIAAWEEQEGFSIGAAGFMAIALSY
jgi:hypothetical protein